MDCESGCIAALCLISGFLLGMVVATLILIFIPKSHRFIWEALNFKLCTRPPEKISIQEIGVTTYCRSQFYTDIDEEIHVNGSAVQQDRDATTHQSTLGRARKGYEHCHSSMRGPHKYSSIEMGCRVDYKPEVYEAVEINSVTEEEEDEDIYAPNHIYSILDPNSNTRLPVRPLPKEAVQPKPDHVYFVLEPGTDQVKPLFAGTSTLKRMDDRIYFVLEPMEEVIDDSNAYAVSDLNPEFYILEHYGDGVTETEK